MLLRVQRLQVMFLFQCFYSKRSVFLCEAELAIHILDGLRVFFLFLFKGRAGKIYCCQRHWLFAVLLYVFVLPQRFALVWERCVCPVLLVQWRRLTLARKSANRLCYWRVNWGEFVVAYQKLLFQNLAPFIS